MMKKALKPDIPIEHGMEPQGAEQLAGPASAEAPAKSGVDYFSGLPYSFADGTNLSAKLSVGLTIGATIVANLALGLPKRVAEVDIPIGKSGKPATTQTHPDIQIDVASDERWARFFSADEQAGELTSPKELTKVTDEIAEILKSGKKIDKMTIEGHSSDEDDNTDELGHRTGGLQQSSDNNLELAKTRSTVFEEILKKKLRDDSIKIPQVEVKSPVEDMLSDKEVSAIQGLVEKFGYSGVEPMISAYNRKQGVPKEVESRLNHLLAQERKVVVTISASEIKPGASATEKDRKITIPIPLFLLIPIPRMALSRRPMKGGTYEPVTDLPIVPRQPIKRQSVEPSGNSHPQDQLPTSRVIRNTMPVRSYPNPDEVFRTRTMNGHKAHRPKTRSIIVQPRPHNFHGTRSANKNIGRARGGNRRGARSRVG